eukprot:scaffold839_cov14-Tisochrysis_lutea.AAC.1
MPLPASQAAFAHTSHNSPHRLPLLLKPLQLPLQVGLPTPFTLQPGSRRQSLGSRTASGLPEVRGVDRDGPAIDKKVGDASRTCGQGENYMKFEAQRMPNFLQLDPQKHGFGGCTACPGQLSFNANEAERYSYCFSVRRPDSNHEEFLEAKSGHKTLEL